MRDASAQELLLLSALQECRMRLDAMRADAAAHGSIKAALDAALERARMLESEVARERERTEAVRVVLGALADSIGRFGLRRAAFRARIAQAGRATPDEGPGAARHPVLLAEARRVLGLGPDPDGSVNAPITPP